MARPAAACHTRAVTSQVVVRTPFRRRFTLFFSALAMFATFASWGLPWATRSDGSEAGLSDLAGAPAGALFAGTLLLFMLLSVAASAPAGWRRPAAAAGGTATVFLFGLVIYLPGTLGADVAFGAGTALAMVGLALLATAFVLLHTDE